MSHIEAFSYPVAILLIPALMSTFRNLFIGKNAEVSLWGIICKTFNNEPFKDVKFRDETTLRHTLVQDRINFIKNKLPAEELITSIIKLYEKLKK
jgi:hypothetical protein